MTQAPEDLRNRLEAVIPGSYPALDLEGVVSRGRRSVRRHRWGAVLATTAAVVAVVTAGLATGGALTASRLTPADPSHVVGFVTWSLPETPSGGDESDYMVAVHAPDGQSQEVDFVHQTGSGRQTFSRSVVDLSHPVASWKLAPGGHVVLGLIPSTSVSQVQLDAGEGQGPNTSVVPTVGWTAFSFVLGASGAGPSHFRGVQWSDLQHRPVDGQGRVGTAVPIGSGCWVTASADLRDYALDCGENKLSPLSTIAPGGAPPTPGVLWTQGPTSPNVLIGLGVTRGSTDCVVKDASGVEEPMPTVPLGSYQFGLHVLTFSRGQGHADSVSCRDHSGVPFTHRLP